LSVFLFTRKGGSFKLTQRTILLSLGILISSVVMKYIQKLGAMHDSLYSFMFWQYIGATIFGIVIAYLFESKKIKEITYIKRYWKGSILIALFSVTGGWAILKALSLGPLSGVFAIHPAYTFVAGIFGYLFFKETLTKKKISLVIV